jgi:hypothetical protein
MADNKLQGKRWLTGILLFACLIALVTCTTQNPADVSGGTSENGNAMVSGHLYNANGTPARNALVRLYRVDYNPSPVPLSKSNAAVYAYAITDTAGKYSLDTLASGDYNILGMKDDNLSFRDSVPVRQDYKMTVPSDTLKQPGSLRGIVRLLFEHDSKNIFILVMGTQYFTAPADTSGRFRLDSLPEGSYNVRFMPTKPDYDVFDTILKITAGITDTLKDTIRLKFNGIATPGGLTAIYDTLHGVVNLSWNKVPGTNIAGYNVYRHDVSSQTPEKISGARVVADTFYADTVFRDIMDSSDLVYIYQLKAQDTNANLGPAFSSSQTVNAVSPTKVRTYLAIMNSGTVNDTASIHDSITFSVTYGNASRHNVSLTWFQPGIDTLAVKPCNGAPAGKDTIKMAWGQPSRKTVAVAVVDEAGSTWIDSNSVTIITDAPVVNAGNDTLVSIKDSILLKGSAIQKFGAFVEWAWDIGNTGVLKVSRQDTVVVAPASANANYLCILRVKDDDGNYGYDTVKASVVQDVPVAEAGQDTVIVMGERIDLHGSASQKFGSIVKWEWDVGNTGNFIQTSTGEHSAPAPARPDSNYKCILRVTDDDGNTATDTVETPIADAQEHVIWYKALTNQYSLTDCSPGPCLPPRAFIHEGKTYSSTLAQHNGSFTGDNFAFGSGLDDLQGRCSAYWSRDLCHTTGTVISAKLRGEFRDGWAGNALCNAGPIKIVCAVVDFQGNIDFWGNENLVDDAAVWKDDANMLGSFMGFNLLDPIIKAVDTIHFAAPSGRPSGTDPSVLDGQFFELDVTNQVNWILKHTKEAGETQLSGQYAIVFLVDVGKGSTGKVHGYATENGALGTLNSDAHWTKDGNTIHLYMRGFVSFAK